MLLASGVMLSITLLLALFLWPILVADNLSVVSKVIYAIFVLLMIVVLIEVSKVYRASRSSWCEINRQSKDISLRFGEKVVAENLGEFKHLLIQLVKIPRGSQYAVVLVAENSSVYLHISDISLSKLEKDLDSVKAFLDIDFVVRSTPMGRVEFEKLYSAKST